jgi:hypothetical protein
MVVCAATAAAAYDLESTIARAATRLPAMSESRAIAKITIATSTSRMVEPWRESGLCLRDGERVERALVMVMFVSPIR